MACASFSQSVPAFRENLQLFRKPQQMGTQLYNSPLLGVLKQALKAACHSLLAEKVIIGSVLAWVS